MIKNLMGTSDRLKSSENCERVQEFKSWSEHITDDLLDKYLGINSYNNLVDSMEDDKFKT